MTITSKFKPLGIAIASSVALAFALPVYAESLKVGTDGGAEPWTFTDASGQLIGYDIDVANEVCTRMSVECEFIVTDWNGIFPALQLGKFDIILAGVNVTDERLKTMDFTRSYAFNLSAFAAKSGSELASYTSSVDVINLDAMTPEAEAEIEALNAALEGVVVGTQTGNNVVPFMEEYFGDVELREYEKLETRDLDMQAERLGAGISGNSYWGKLADKDEVDIVAVGPKFGGGVLGGDVAAPMKQGRPELKAQIDAALNSMIEDGSLSELAIKWLGSDASPKN